VEEVGEPAAGSVARAEELAQRVRGVAAHPPQAS
jgi:hypothetical protein